MSDSDSELFGNDDAIIEQRKSQLSAIVAPAARAPKPSADEFPVRLCINSASCCLIIYPCV